MTRLISFTSLLFTLILTVGCERARTHQDKIPAFGTDIEVSIHSDDADLAQQALAGLRQDFQLMHTAWHAWKPGSLGRVNSLLATGRPFSAGPSVLDLIEAATPLARQSDHLFNPAIGKLIALWGFHQDQEPAAVTPDPALIEALLRARPSMDDLEIRGVQLRSGNPDLQLDFGAFAKGYGIDQAIQHLQALGIDNALIKAGDDLSAIGSRGAHPWSATIRDPINTGILATLDLSKYESVFTSGSHTRSFEKDKKRFHHIIDPRTGYPARGSLSVTVIHPSAATADAAATAIFIAGPDGWPRIARRMGIQKILLIDERGQYFLTPAMADRIHFTHEPSSKPIIVEPFAKPITGITPSERYNMATIKPALEPKPPE